MRRSALCLSGLMVVGFGSLAAQAPGLPVINAGVVRGFTVAAMAGFPNDAAGDGTGLLAGATIGGRRVAFGGFVSRIDSPYLSGEKLNTVGANLGFKILGGPLVPVALTLQAGAGYSAASLVQGAGGYDDKVKTWRVPVGVGISWTFPRPVVALKPWIAPRLDYTRIDAPAGSLLLVDDSRTSFGLSGGISFGFLNGLAIDVAVDRLFTEGSGKKPMTLGAGVSYTFR